MISVYKCNVCYLIKLHFLITSSDEGFSEFSNSLANNVSNYVDADCERPRKSRQIQCFMPNVILCSFRKYTFSLHSFDFAVSLCR